MDIFSEDEGVYYDEPRTKTPFNWNYILFASVILCALAFVFVVSRGSEKQGQDEGGEVEQANAAVLVVYEKDRLPNETQVSELQSEADYWSGLKERGVYWRFYDVEADEIKDYRTDAEKAGLPAVLIIGPNRNGEGVVKRSGNFETVEAAKTIIEKGLK
jgi:hypothetical protein